MPRLWLCALVVLVPFAALAGADEGTCDTALLLAVDVSNSVDDSEYRLQIDGLADALRDPEVAEALVDGQVALLVMQWSGPDQQRVAIPWRRMAAPADPTFLSATVRALPRAYVRAGTAPAEAILRALDLLAEASPCGRQVIDMSGDGVRNSGGPVPPARDAASARGVTINAVAIETLGTKVADFYLSDLVTPGGFVARARGHGDYPRAIRAKILRELGPPTT
jgi:Ca-activated chloride channel family protein